MIIGKQVFAVLFTLALVFLIINIIVRQRLILFILIDQYGLVITPYDTCLTIASVSLAEELRESFETQANENEGFHCEDNKELINAGMNEKHLEGSHFEDFVKA